MQMHPWLTKGGEEPLPLEEEHCTVVEVTEEEVKNSVKTIPSLPAVVCINHNRILCMGQEHGTLLELSTGEGGLERVHMCSWHEKLGLSTQCEVFVSLGTAAA